MRMFFIRTTLLVSILMAGGAAIVRAAEPVTVKFRALCFDPRESETPEFFVAEGKGTRKLLELDKSSLSVPQEAPVREGRMVDFYLSKEPKKDEKPALTAKLPEGPLDRMLLVFAPSGTSYQAWAIPLPPENFPAGGRLLVNLSPVELAVRIEDGKPVTVLPSKHQFLKSPSGLKDDMMSIEIYKRTAATEPWTIVQSTRWGVDVRFRSYVFFYQPADSRIKLHAVSERL